MFQIFFRILLQSLVLSVIHAFPLHLKRQPFRSSLFLSSGKNQDQPVQVYENTFSSSACEMLHYLTVEHNERTNDGSSFFTRPPHNDRPLTPLEHAMDSALIEIGDETKRVEYWSRDEYMNIDAHADIDEAMLEDDAVIRCPLVGHVLYLQVKEDLHGPTCVFPGERTGWGLDEHKAEDIKKDLVIVPAVEGRLLRFQGSAMHAVPNPVDRWLMNKQDEKTLREKEDKCEEDDEEVWLDDDDFDDDDFEDDDVERSVILFNTWPDDEPGPRGVNGDIATGALPEGIELSEEDANAFLESQEAQILSEWENRYGENSQRIRCNPFSQWESVEVRHLNNNDLHDSTEDYLGRVNVSLMGMKNRRLYPKKYAALKGPIQDIRNALGEDTNVSIASLTIDD